jgi:hypothetical protein
LGQLLQPFPGHSAWKREYAAMKPAVGYGG